MTGYPLKRHSLTLGKAFGWLLVYSFFPNFSKTYLTERASSYSLYIRQCSTATVFSGIMSSTASSSSSSRSSTDESQIGLLVEKQELDYDQGATRASTWLNPHTPRTRNLDIKLCLSIRYISRAVGQVFRLLVPSFLHQRSPNDQERSDKLAPTAFLDGMRGLAAFAVFICHLTYGTSTSLMHGGHLQT